MCFVSVKIHSLAISWQNNSTNCGFLKIQTITAEVHYTKVFLSKLNAGFKVLSFYLMQQPNRKEV